jgi:hypothetical protein
VTAAPRSYGSVGARAVFSAAAALRGVPLAEVAAAALMDRVDTKFLLPAARVPELLRALAPDYRVLDVRGRRLARYRTDYFDTPDLALYHAHHAGRVPRWKVRVRAYVDDGTRFLEVKRRGHGGRTAKARIPLARREAPDELPAAALDAPPLRALAPPTAGPLCLTATVTCRRVTLVRDDLAERVTIDLALTVGCRGVLAGLPGLAVVELKQRQVGPSPLLDAMRRLGERPTPVSKYCLAVAALHPAARTNAYRPLLRRVRLITELPAHGTLAHAG